MDVARPYRSVVPSVDGDVLFALARLSGPVTGRQVHQIVAARSEAGVRAVLNRLAHQGLVRASHAGNAILYSVNREHVAWPAVRELAALRTTFLDRVQDSIGNWNLRPRAAAVFGSFARGDGDADSDIDLLLVRTRRVSATNDAWQAQLAELRENVFVWTGNRCQIYEIGLDELERDVRAGTTLVSEWKRDAVNVFGTDVRQLIHQAELAVRA